MLYFNIGEENGQQQQRFPGVQDEDEAGHSPPVGHILDCRAVVFTLPLLCLPVSYGGLHSQTWIPRPPFSFVVDLKICVFVLNTKHTIRGSGLSTPGFLRTLMVQHGSKLEARTLICLYS